MSEPNLRVQFVHRRWGVLPTILFAGAFALAACTIGPWRLSVPERATTQPAIILRRCDQARDVVCVLSFGLEPPDQMVTVLLASPGLPANLEARATWDASVGTYPCEPTNADATLLACTGPVIPLGSGVHLDVVDTESGALIASGNLVLNGVALPTVPVGAELPPTESVTVTPQATGTTKNSVTVTPRPTPTPAIGTPYPNPKL